MQLWGRDDVEVSGGGLTASGGMLPVGGTLRVESGGGHGTRIHGVVPVSGVVRD
jgi:hypothetical protein